MAVHRLSLVETSGGYSLLAMCRLLIAAASLIAEQGLKSLGSVVVVHGLSGPEIWGSLPGPWIEPASPALQGAFLTTGPPGKPHSDFLHCK